MELNLRTIAGDIERDGYSVVRDAFRPEQIAAWRHELDGALAGDASASVLRHAGRAYASRNLLLVWPDAMRLARSAEMVQIMEAILGAGCGLVRGLLFDKPPEQTWSLPWHQDMTIAVRDNRLPTLHFSKPTRKAGVPHVEAPLGVLQRMLTARIHLDDVTEENGPLRVIPGSHHWGKSLHFERDPAGHPAAAIDILVRAGDVLLIRPLVAHSSLSSLPGTTRHRRIVHLEHASAEPLPDRYAWNLFERLTTSADLSVVDESPGATFH